MPKEAVIEGLGCRMPALEVGCGMRPTPPGRPSRDVMCLHENEVGFS